MKALQEIELDGGSPIELILAVTNRRFMVSFWMS